MWIIYWYWELVCQLWVQSTIGSTVVAAAANQLYARSPAVFLASKIITIAVRVRRGVYQSLRTTFELTGPDGPRYSSPTGLITRFRDWCYHSSAWRCALLSTSRRQYIVTRVKPRYTVCPQKNKANNFAMSLVYYFFGTQCTLVKSHLSCVTFSAHLSICLSVCPSRSAHRVLLRYLLTYLLTYIIFSSEDFSEITTISSISQHTALYARHEQVWKGDIGTS